MIIIPTTKILVPVINILLIFINSKEELYFASLTQKPSVLDFSLEQINSEFKDKVYLYKFTQVDDKITLDLSTESELTAVPGQNLTSLLMKLDFHPVDLSVRNIVMSSPADKAGIRKGDILVALNGKDLTSFEELRSGLQVIEDGKEVDVVVLTKGKLEPKKLLPEVKEIDKKKTKILLEKNEQQKK